MMTTRLAGAAAKDVRSRSVIIVGAGAASVQLAHKLSSSPAQPSPPLRVTILEANDYIGGRVRSSVFEGHTVEMGANWISGRETAVVNPIWQLAKTIGLQGHLSDRSNPERILVLNTAVAEVGKKINRDVAEDVTTEYLQLAEQFDTIYNKAVKQGAANESADSDSGADVSVRSLLEANGWTRKQKLTNMERAVEHNVLEVWVADHLEHLSATHDMMPGANDVDLGQDEMFVEDSRGFNSIFKGMIADLQKDGSSTTILLRHAVETIHYAPGNVKVIAKDLSNGKKIEIEADMIVSTVSLGVLQSNAIEFVPPFPKWKTKALNEIKMFNFAKVFVKFRRRLWPESKEYLVFVSEGEDGRGYYPFWMKYKNTNDDNNLLMCYLGGAQARRVESLDEEQIKDEIEDLFCRAFGNHEDCRPESVSVTDWSHNPRFCGSYSYFPRGAFCTGVPQQDLWRGLDGVAELEDDDDDETKMTTKPSSLPTTLYFAGEAFDDKFNGWVQGGYLSGERTAKKILQDYNIDMHR